MNMKWTIGIVAFIAVVYGTVVLARQAEQPLPGEAIAIMGRDHIAVGASHPDYNSNSPTSGWHYAQEANWGISSVELPDEQVLHNLEHGGVRVSYKGVDDATKTALENLARSYQKVIIEPRSKNDAPIVLASWGRLQKFQTLDEQAIRAFIEANRNRSPEPSAN